MTYDKKTFALDEVLYKIFVLDILFAPFLFPVPVPVPVSFAIIPIWFFSISRPIPTKLILLTSLGIVFTLISYIYGYGAGVSEDIAFQRLVNTAIIMFMFSSNFLARMTILDEKFILKALTIYLLFNTVLSLVYFISPYTYFEVRSFWTFGSNAKAVVEFGNTTRFTGIMSDPNNFSASICAISSFILAFYQKKTVQIIFIMLIAAFMVASTMSATGAICYILFVGGYVFGSRMSASRRLVIAGLLMVSGFSAYLIVMDTEVLTTSIERIVNSDPDSRLSRWAVAMDMHKFVSSIFIGDGGSVILNGSDFRPHNGHIHIIFSFGAVCYIAFMSIFFGINKSSKFDKNIFMLIIFIIFTVNVGVYEHRFAGLWVILISTYQQMLNRNREFVSRAG